MTDKKILLLCENDSDAQIDRRLLRDAGFVNVRIAHSGIEAARVVARISEADDKYYPDIIVCARKLEDMDGEQFCAIIREHPRLLSFPILLILPSEEDADQLSALGCGASAMLGRPYSADKLKTRVETLLKTHPGKACLKLAEKQCDTRAFDAALATYGILLRPSREPEDFFRLGMKCLKEARWNQAIGAFQIALTQASIKADAEMGMAAAYRGKGDMERFREWLARAVETLIKARRWHRARSAFARLLKHDPGARNPFIVRARELIKEKNYEDAAQTLVESLEVMKSASPGDKFAALCMGAEDPDSMFKALESGLSARGEASGSSLASEVRQSINALAAEKKERERIMTIERKWRLAREMAERKKREPESAPIEEPRAPEAVPFGEEDVGEGYLAPDAVDNFNDSETDDDDSVALEPLAAPPKSDPFAKKTRMSDILSVVKLTWKLARRDK